jgi:hypothetical protein
LEKIAAAPQAREPRTLLRVAQPQEYLPSMPRLVFISSRSDEWRALATAFLTFFLENFSICTISFDIVP